MLKRMDLNKITPNDILNMKSERHHYIPQFLAAGFIDYDRKFYVYDKIKDRIIDNKQSTKSIFFEKKRNTVKLKKGEESALLEEVFYKEMDNYTKKVIKHFQDEDLKKIEFNKEMRGLFIGFIIELFWRVPYTDDTVLDLIKRADIKWGDLDQEMLKTDSTFQKMHRTYLGQHTLNEIISDKTSKQEVWNVHQMGQGDFVLGDNPILFIETPKLFTDINNNDLLFAVSSNRIVSKTELPLKNFNFHNNIKFNVSIIHQSLRYVAGKNIKMLEESINLYKKYKGMGILDYIRKQTFKSN